MAECAVAGILTDPRRSPTFDRAREIDRPAASLDIGRGAAAESRLLGNRGSLPSNAAAHVACWRCVPVVPGRCGMCAVPAAHLARRLLQQHLLVGHAS